MRALLPPVCLLLALAMMVAGFCLWVVEPPAATLEIYRAAADGDELYRQAAEAQLRRRRQGRRLLVGALFCGGVLAAAVAFLAMHPATDVRRQDEE